MTLLKIPYGISNYRTIAREGYAYVDKTRYIRVLEEYSSPFVVLLRPRRFGKSLFASVLNCYYDIAEKDNFEHLFLNTDIGRDPTSRKNSYFVLNFNFSGIASESEDELYDSFRRKTRNALQLFIDRYKLDIDIQNSGSAADQLSEFFMSISAKIDRSVYVIIDEYDQFANELLSFHFEVFQNTIGKNGFIRKWYEVLKEATATIVDRIFITGVSPITLDSLTSGFNISDNISRLSLVHEIMGFTSEEIHTLFKKTVPEEIDYYSIDKTLQEYYNGYRFCEDAEKRLFNSDMVLYYVKNYQICQKPPKSLLDTNIAGDYGKLGNLLRIKNPVQNIDTIKEIVTTGFVTANITSTFSMDLPFTKDDFKSLLYYLGLLSIRESLPGAVSLQIPNYVIRGLYYDFFLEIIAREAPFQVEPDRIRDAIYQIAYEGKCDKLVNLIEELLHAFSNRDFIGFDEKYIKIAIFAYANMSSLYLVKSEYEVSDGYIDLALLKRDPWHPDYYALFELKYVKKSMSSDEKIEKVTNEGIKQLNQYVSSPELSSIPNLKRWVLVFCGDRCVRKEEL